MARAATPEHALRETDPIALVTDLIRLEIVLWERIDVELRERHELPLPFFESLRFIAQAPTSSLRVGDLAAALRITVGGASKLVDRIEAAGLIARRPDPEDRRASRLGVTPQGMRRLAAATTTYRETAAALLDRALAGPEQAELHSLLGRLSEASTTEPREEPR
jgi:DNA-binding MarR family transcriptional regulator